MIKKRRSCYCAFCKTSRKVYAHKNLSLHEIFGLIFLGIIITYVFYKSFDPRGLMFVGLLLLTGEIFCQVKWRASMLCKNCGFDPVLYVRNPEDAGLKIKAFLEKRPYSVDHLLRPPIVLPRVKAPFSPKMPKMPIAPKQNLSLKV